MDDRPDPPAGRRSLTARAADVTAAPYNAVGDGNFDFHFGQEINDVLRPTI